jgi:hypothetical protein
MESDSTGGKIAMMDTVLNLLFRCSHRRLSRPLSPAHKKGVAPETAYVVCLDCGKHFAYDTKQMRLGKRIEDPEIRGLLPERPLKPTSGRLRFALLWAGLPLAVLAGSVLKIRKQRPDQPAKPPDNRDTFPPR